MRRFFSVLVAVILATLSVIFLGSNANATTEVSYENQSGFVLWPCDNAVVNGRETVKVQITATRGDLSPTDDSVMLSSNSGDIVAYEVAPSIFDTGVIAQELPVAFSGIKATTGARLTVEIVEGAKCPKPDPVYSPYVYFGKLVCEDGVPSAPATLDNTQSTDTIGFDVSTSTGYSKVYSVKAGMSKDIFVPLTQGAKTKVFALVFDTELASQVFDARKCVEPTNSVSPTPSNSESPTVSPSPSVTVTDTPKPSESPSSNLTPTTKPVNKTPSIAAVAAELPKTGGGMTLWLVIGAIVFILGGAAAIAISGRSSHKRKH